VSRSGVLLNVVTAIFQFCRSGRAVRREAGARYLRSENPDVGCHLGQPKPDLNA
jgi:hypothetical protein